MLNSTHFLTCYTLYSPAPENKQEYGSDYYGSKVAQMSHGYKHPYHTTANPIFFSQYHYMKTLFEAVGPE